MKYLAGILLIVEILYTLLVLLLSGNAGGYGQLTQSTIFIILTAIFSLVSTIMWFSSLRYKKYSFILLLISIILLGLSLNTVGCQLNKVC